MPASPWKSLSIALKAWFELGPIPLLQNALYRFGLASGHYRRVLETAKRSESGAPAAPLLPGLFRLPAPGEVRALLGEAGVMQAHSLADEITQGRVRLFGAEPVDLRLAVDPPLADWSAYEAGRARVMVGGQPARDIKFIWEPARFSWVFPLGRAYLLSGDEKYPQAFWRFFEQFSSQNPPYLGPQWVSGQEAALRLLAFAWAGQVFSASAASTPARMEALARSIALHARRIPPTLVYARSQQNNHLLSEAAGVFTAGLALPGHPQAQGWRDLGWRVFNQALSEQIDGYGEYAQHSVNYHRLMLQLVLWMNALSARHGFHWQRRALEAVTRSVHWLLALLDPSSGQAPNLGANDGAYLFPLSGCPFEDFRPVAHAAARAFLGYDLPRGPWDELCLWFGIPLQDRKYVELPRYLGDQLYGVDSWASLRTAQFKQRPSHADQLHLDLWWRGLNLARDAGTYLYNAPPPWENSLVAAAVHNTVTVDGADQMLRAGRFLYLDWVDAYRQALFETDPHVLQRLIGRYRNPRGSYRHTRRVTVLDDGRWLVEDELLPLGMFSHSRMRHYRLHWLLPDWGWQVQPQGDGVELALASPHGPVRLGITGSAMTSARLSLARAGELLYAPAGGAAEPNRGWVSPTYGVKLPALSLAVECASMDEVQFRSEFSLP